MIKNIILILNIAVLTISIIWFYKTPDFEPAIAVCTTVGALLAYGIRSNTTVISNRWIVIITAIAVAVAILCLCLSYMKQSVIIGIKGDNNSGNQIQIKK